MKDAEIIEALGGHSAVARAIDVKTKIALHFATRGIPFKYRPKVKALARKKRLTLPPDFLEVQRR